MRIKHEINRNNKVEAKRTNGGKQIKTTLEGSWKTKNLVGNEEKKLKGRKKEKYTQGMKDF